MKNTISVIMPARNAEKFIRPAIDSILSQDIDDLELIVVDDGSTDRTARLAGGTGDPRVRVIPGPRQGLSAAMNCRTRLQSPHSAGKFASRHTFTP